MLTTILALALAQAPAELADELPAAQQTLTACESDGCDSVDGARAAWIVALGTYLETGEADGTLAATVRELDADLFGELPPVLQGAATEPADWAIEAPVDLDIAPAATGTAAIVPIGGPLSERGERVISRHLKRDLTWSEPADLPDLEERLRQRTSECVVELTDAEQRAIFGQLSADDEFYLAMPHDSVRKTQLWRLDKPTRQLNKVMRVGRPVDPAPDGPVTVLVLLWEGRADRALARLPAYHAGPEERHVVGNDRDLLDELMEHPNECEPDLSAEARAKVAEIVEDYDGTVILAIGNFPYGRGTYMWRWDRDRQTLLRSEK